MIAIAKEKSYNKNIRPWRSWITQRIPIPEIGGSNPSGRAKGDKRIINQVFICVCLFK